MDLNEYKTSFYDGENMQIVTNMNTANLFNVYPYNDFWTYSYPDTPSTPSTAVVCNKSTVGALNNLIKNSSGENRLLCTGGSISEKGGDYTCYLLIDRLSHQGGLGITTTSPQTTNLPTAALTRYTDGIGVMVGLSIYSNLSTNYTTNVTISYTNQDGVSGRTSPTRPFITSNTNNKTGCFYIIPLQQGDYGVKSVQSVTLSSTRAAGNFGVVLFKPLAITSRGTLTNFGQCNFLDGNMLGSIPEVKDDACLCLLGITQNNNSGSTLEVGSRCVFNLYETENFQQDNIPDSINWDNIAWHSSSAYGNITSKRITGISDTIQLNISEPITSPEIQLYYRISNTEITGTQNSAPASPWIQIVESPGTTFSVSNNQWVSFVCYSTAVKSNSQQIDVINTSNSNTILDSFNIQVDED